MRSIVLAFFLLSVGLRATELGYYRSDSCVDCTTWGTGPTSVSSCPRTDGAGNTTWFTTTGGPIFPYSLMASLTGVAKGTIQIKWTAPEDNGSGGVLVATTKTADISFLHYSDDETTHSFYTCMPITGGMDCSADGTGTYYEAHRYRDDITWNGKSWWIIRSDLTDGGTATIISRTASANVDFSAIPGIEAGAYGGVSLPWNGTIESVGFYDSIVTSDQHPKTKKAKGIGTCGNSYIVGDNATHQQMGGPRGSMWNQAQAWGYDWFMRGYPNLYGNFYESRTNAVGATRLTDTQASFLTYLQQSFPITTNVGMAYMTVGPNVNDVYDLTDSVAYGLQWDAISDTCTATTRT
jgi:hypothetical protein